MELSVFLAQLIGLAYVSIGIGFLTDKKHYQGVYKAISKDDGQFFLFGGMVAFVAGFALVNSHNVWVADWPVVITVFGWIALIKGIALFIFPGVMMDMTRSFLKNDRFISGGGVLALVIGLVLGYFGFVA